MKLQLMKLSEILPNMFEQVTDYESHMKNSFQERSKTLVIHFLPYFFPNVVKTVGKIFRTTATCSRHLKKFVVHVLSFDFFK